MSESFRQLLRALPDFPEALPDFDPAAAPADPAELFRQWLDEALAAGVPQPNACSLATADGLGRPSSRMLILKDIDDDGWHFATSRDSRKGPGTRGQPARGPELLLAAAGPAGPRRRQRRGAVRARPPRPTGTPGPARTAATTPDWQLYAVRPREIEFWQARHDRRHIRHRYGPESFS